MVCLLGAGDATGVPVMAEGMKGEVPSHVKRDTFMEERGRVCSDLQEPVMFFAKVNLRTPRLTGPWFLTLRRHVTDLGVTAPGDSCS